MLPGWLEEQSSRTAADCVSAESQSLSGLLEQYGTSSSLCGSGTPSSLSPVPVQAAGKANFFWRSIKYPSSSFTLSAPPPGGRRHVDVESEDEDGEEKGLRSL